MVVSVGTIVRNRMTLLGLSQASLAGRLGVSQPFVSWVLKDRRAISLKTLEQWTTALELVGEEKEDFFQAVYLAATPAPIVAELLKLREERNLFFPRKDMTASKELK